MSQWNLSFNEGNGTLSGGRTCQSHPPLVVGAEETLHLHNLALGLIEQAQYSNTAL